MESYNWKAKPISPCLGAHEAHPKTTLYSGHAEGGCAAPREPDQVARHADVLGDGVDLIGVVIEAPAPGHAWAGAVAVGLDRDEPVALRPEREDLLPLASAAHAKTQQATAISP